MIDSKENIERIEKYLSNDLSKEETLQLEHDLGSNNDLKELYEDILAIKNGIRAQHLQQKIDFLKTYENEYPLAQNENTHKTPYFSRRRILIYALLVITLLGIGWWLSSQPSTSQKIYEQHLPALVADLSKSEMTKTKYVLLHEAYAHEQYLEVTQIYSSMDDSNRTEENKIYAANAYMHLNKYEQASQLLNGIKDKNLQDVINLHRALIILQRQDISSAINFIEAEYPDGQFSFDIASFYSALKK